MMSTTYYSIKDANRIGDQPVRMIMKTTDYYYISGVYETDSICIKLSHIAQWEYDMLDAFGVEVMMTDRFDTNYSDTTKIRPWEYR